MTPRCAIAAGLTLAVLGCGARDRFPGKPAPGSEPVRPDQVISFAELYGSNCAGCHGPEGRGGAAQSLHDPLYLAIASDEVIRGVIRRGIHATPMPAFARSAGGMLTDAQVDAIVAGIRSWADPQAAGGVDLPAYAAYDSGDAKRGAAAYAVYCASCHGADGRGGPRASSIVDSSYLALVSNQFLRTTVIVGRPDLGAPDFRGNVPGKAMSAQDISDVVAWLAAQRLSVSAERHPAARTAVGESQ